MKTEKKDLIKIIAVAAAGVIAGTGVTAAAFGTANKTEDTENTSAASSQAAETTEQKKPSKDETVYVLANADGSVKKIIVSDWIKNNGGKTVSDKTELSDIKNVKGDESYVMDTDNMREWNADGKDIYYQGTISKALPVDLKVSYELDGKPVSAESLAGKSGKVTIRFDYTNNQYKNVSIDGKNTKIYVPFVMLTVENYKTVIGGLLENPTDSQKAELINIADAALNAKLSAIGVPQNYYGAVKVLLATKLSSGETQESAMAEIAAMLQNISDPQNAAAIGAAAATAESENGKQIINAFCLNLANQTLEPTVKEAMAQLDSYNEFYKGVLTYTAGTKQAYDGSTELKNGAKELSDGANALKSGSSQLVGGVQQLTDGSKRLADGLKEFNEKGISKLTSLAGDDLGSLVTRIKATVEVSRDYKSFAGIADGTYGDVKFIYRTDEIK